MDDTDVEDNRIDDDDDDTLLDIASIVARGGNRRDNIWGSVQVDRYNNQMDNTVRIRLSEISN